MDHVTEIFDAFGGPAKLSKAIGLPIQTVADWRTKGKPGIPPWRRPAVLTVMAQAEKPLSLEAVRYLQSADRPARASRPSSEQAAA